ncbi:Metal binding domain of Ada [Persephonella hydrogeniphila]|uniref:Metal binding domain of Ada n=1 Tax=Persephonella hydrogeniphila TaxID=198703 RepID=A0A285NBA5_9AQUI|nr:Ada metal-binding domain-containing protein [Persephonella hydrogeniphila]SNZ06217.1 Metal binding domain of Ada [Persephonella hydrogeniphila]
MFVFLLLTGIFYFSYAQERVIIENRGTHYHVESYTEPSYSPKKSKKKHYSKKKERFYISKQKGKVFHRPSCRFAKKIKNKKVFKTRRKAVNAGLRPCKLCKP